MFHILSKLAIMFYLILVCTVYFQEKKNTKTFKQVIKKIICYFSLLEGIDFICCELMVHLLSVLIQFLVVQRWMVKKKIFIIYYFIVQLIFS